MLDTTLTEELELAIADELAAIPGKPLFLHVDLVSPSKERYAFWLTSPTVGGLLASNRKGAGWVPCWPEKPNYPCSGRWYSNEDRPLESWREAVRAAIYPERCYPHFNALDDGGKRTVVTRAARLRDPLRAATLWALLGGAP